MNVRVSDHAVLRWLERVEGVDVAAIRRRIANAVQGGADRGAVGVRQAGVTFKLQYNPGEAVVTTTHSPHPRAHLSVSRAEYAELQRLRKYSGNFLVVIPSELAAWPAATFMGFDLTIEPETDD